MNPQTLEELRTRWARRLVDQVSLTDLLDLVNALLEEAPVAHLCGGPMVTERGVPITTPDTPCGRGEIPMRP